MTNKINNNQNLNSSLTLIDLIHLFTKNFKKIVIITGLFCIISIILYFFVFKLIFLSDATIKSSVKSSGLMSVLDGGGLPDIGGLDDIGLSGSKSAKELAVYEEILKSRRCLEALILHFKIMEKEEYLFLEDAVKDFRENRLTIKQDKLSGIMSIGIYDEDPIVAKDMLVFLLDILDKINIEMNVLNAKNNREFIEKRYNQAKEDLVKSEDSLKSFQLIYGIAPDMQIKASAQAVFSLEAELKAEEVKLDVIKNILSNNEPEVKLQESKVNSLRTKISEVQTSTDLTDFLRLGNSPQIAQTYLRLVRDVEIQTKILSFMVPIYEQAKIEEKRETPTVIILDQPNIAERKSKPKRLTMVLIITFLGFFSATSFFILKYKYDSFKKEYLQSV